MYWFRDHAERDVALSNTKYTLDLMAEYGDNYLHSGLSKLGLRESFLFHWIHHVESQSVFEDLSLFEQLSEEDQMRLQIEFIRLVKKEKDRLIRQWHWYMKPWAVRLQQLVIEHFQLTDFEVDVQTRVYHHGETSGYVGDFRMDLSRSFKLFFPAYGTSDEHHTTYPYVFCIVDKKEQLFSVHSPLPEEAQANIDHIREHQPVKYKEYLKVHALEVVVWTIWHDEMKAAGVTYQPAYVKKG